MTYDPRDTVIHIQWSPDKRERIERAIIALAGSFAALDDLIEKAAPDEPDLVAACHEARAALDKCFTVVTGEEAPPPDDPNCLYCKRPIGDEPRYFHNNKGPLHARCIP